MPRTGVVAGYSPAQAAHRLQLTPARVRQLLAEGKLDYVETPIGRVVMVESVERLAAQREQPERELVPA